MSGGGYRANIPLSAVAEEAFGPSDVMSTFLFDAVDTVSDLGVELYLHSDFNRLFEVNRQNRDHWFPIMPMFDPNCSDLTGLQSGFWIEGRTSGGRIVVAQCARHYHLPDSSVADEMTSMRFFYSDPAAFAAPEENCRCTAPSARMLANHVCYSGGTWFHPDYRGRDLASLLPRISRTLALGLWQTDYTLSLVERVLIEKGIVGRYGYKNVEPGVDWTGSPIHGDLYLHLIWMDRPTLLQDLAARTESTEGVRGARSKRQPEPALH